MRTWWLSRSRVPLTPGGAVGPLLLLATLCGRAAAEPADSLLAAGRYPEAVAAARVRVSTQPTDGHAWHVLGQAHGARGESQEALGAYERARLQDRDHRLQIEVAVARLLRLAGEHEAATQRLRGVLAAYRADRASLASAELVAAAEAARLLGREESGLYRTAGRIYEEAMARDGENLAARVGLGDLLLEKYNNTEALALYREALDIDARYPPAMLGLARSQHFDHSATAIQTVRRALEVQPTLVPARVLLARLLVELEDYDAAEGELARALAVNPKSPEALTLAAAVHHLRGDRAAFEASVALAREVGPGYVELYATLAEIAAQNRLYQDAIVFARQGVLRDPQFWRAHGLLGLNQLRTGQMEAGRASLETAFRGDPFNIWFKNTLDLLDRLHRFRTLRHGRFVLVAEAGEAEVLAPLLFPLAEAAYAHFAERYEHEPETPLRIEVYPRHQDFSVRTVGLVGVDILGVSFGPTVALDSPSARAEEAPGSVNWGSVVWHELAHTFHLSMSGSRVPRWFSEGLAVLEERRARPGWGADVDPGFLEALRNGRLLPASRLNEAFLRPSYPGQLAHAYFQASLLLEFFEDRYGIEAIKTMLVGYREGRSTEALVATVLGLTPEALDRVFDAHVRDRFAHALAAVSPAAEAPDAGGSFLALWRSGRDALEAGDLEGAELALLAAKALFPEFAGAGSPYHLLAELYVRRGETSAAAAELQQVIDIDANDLAAHRELAKLHVAAGNSEAAARALERARLINPFEIAMRTELGTIYESTGAWERAVTERAAVAALNPPDPAAARYRLANALNRSGRHAAARREVLQALEIAPLYAEALELLLEVREALRTAAQGSVNGAEDSGK